MYGDGKLDFNYETIFYNNNGPIIIGGSLHSHMSMPGGIAPQIHVLCAIVVGHAGAKIIMGDALNFEL